jgi:hypothetical protein
MMRQYELVEKVRSYDPSADEEEINRAYVYSMKAHGSQVRASGDPYFSHPIEVAGILTRGYRIDPRGHRTAVRRRDRQAGRRRHQAVAYRDPVGRGRIGRSAPGRELP